MKKILLFLFLLPTLAFAQLELPYPVKVVNPKPLDFWYFESDGTPYDNTTEVTSQVLSAIRYRGMTFNVNGVEYWFGAGITDPDLVVKGVSYTFSNGLTNTAGAVKLGGTLTQTTLINPSTFGLEVATSTGRTGFISNSTKFRANKVLDAYTPLFATGFTLSVNVVTSGGGSVTWSTTNIPTGGVTLYCGILEYNGGSPLWVIYDQFTVNIPDGSPVVISGFGNFSTFYGAALDGFIIVVPNNGSTYPYVSYHNLTTDIVNTGSYSVTESTGGASLTSDEKLTLTNQDGHTQGWNDLAVPFYGLNNYYELNSGHNFVGNTTILGNYDIEGIFTGRVPSFTLRNSADTQTLFSVSEGAVAAFNIRADGSGGGSVNSIVASTTSTSSGELVITSGSSGSTAGELTLQSYGDLNLLAGYDPIASAAGNIIINAPGGGYTQVSSPLKVSGLSTEGDIPVIDVSGNFSALGVGTDTHVLTMVAGLPAWAAPSGGGDVTKVGTPVDNQIGVWTGDGTIEGTTGLTYNGSNLQLTGDIGSTGTRITKGWFTDLQVTNPIAGSITGNAATVTTNANLTGHITSTGNAAVLGSFTVGQLSTAISDADISGTNTGDQSISVTGTTTATIDLSGDATDASITGAGISAVSVVGNAITVTSTEVDGSISNEGSLTVGTGTGTTSIINSNTSGSTGVTLTAGTGLSIAEAGNVITLANTGIITEVDGSTSNELQTITNTSNATTHTVTLSATGGSVQLAEGSNITLTTTGTGADGVVTIASTGGGGITNGAAANELMKSDGTNAVASGIESTTLGDISMGLTGTTGATRNLFVAGSATDIGMYQKAKGAGTWRVDAFSHSFFNIATSRRFSIDNTSGTEVNLAYAGGYLYLKGDPTNTLANAHIKIEASSASSGTNAGGDVSILSGAPTGGGSEGSVAIQTRATGKLGFFNATPVVKQSAPTTTQGIADVLTAYGLIPSSTISGGGGGLTYAQVKAMKFK